MIRTFLKWLPFAAGRNMREVEYREVNLGHQVFVAWIVTLLASLVAVWIGVRFRRVKLY